MKICLIADTHLFSSEIGGNWSNDSLIIFKEKFLPKVKGEKPDVILLLGDILDPHSGKSDPRWPKGDDASGKFVESLKKVGVKNVYALRGNHDYVEPLRNISVMGGPHFIEDDWLKVKDTAIYFFSSRYPNIQKAIDGLNSIPYVDAEIKILVMHENLSIRGADNIPMEVLKQLSERFDMVFNGHQHVFQKLYGNIYCLSSAFPWRPGYGNSDVEIVWEGEELEIKENENKFGFYILDVNKKDLEFIPVDIGVKIVSARLRFADDSASLVRKRLIELSKKLPDIITPKTTIMRVYLEGQLKEGEERIDVGFSNVDNKYYSNFYEGRSKSILRVDNLRGGGAYLSKDDLRYISVEDALKQLEAESPEVRDFYKEVGDLIEKKTFDGEALLERIKNSKVLDKILGDEK
ncbi:MAG: exonuclease SbcCD subunit D [Candidatus Hodarchaeota archaeon]